MYLAMTDSKVDIIYDLVVIFFIIILFIYSNKISKNNITKSTFNKEILTKFKNVKFVLIIIVLLLFLGILFSPEPSIYLKFSYFYTHTYNISDNIYIYHRTIINSLINLTFFLTILFYATKSSKSSSLTYFLVFIITWINGKRTLFVFLLLAILAIDFLKCDKKNKKYIKKLILKSIMFIIIIVSYFLIYNEITQKVSFSNGYLQYTTYFSRMCNVKVAIYDMLNGKIILKYPGESLLYNLLWFIPRSIWKNKPYPYYKYFTSYVFSGIYNGKISNSNFQVNMLSEFISNFGIIFGTIMSLILIIKIIKTSENSNNKITYFSGVGFVAIYMMYGFENIVRYIFLIWFFSKIYTFISKKFKFK